MRAATARLLALYGVYCWLHYNSNQEDADHLLEAIKQDGGDAKLIQSDLKQSDQVVALAETVSREKGVDILVNNSGTTRDALLMDMKTDAFCDVTDINLAAPFILIRDLGKAMMKKGGGKIVNISSVAASRGGAGQANYAASKAGLESLTRTAAIELGPFGINVNSVAPGVTRTNMTAHLMEVYNKKLKRSVPLRRLAEPSDIANVILFLVSPLADYITGQTIIADGGYTITAK